MKNLLLTVLIATFGWSASGQQTGDFTLTILTIEPSLNGDSLDIYFHVPDSYTPSVPSKMVLGFHGLGNPDNSNQIRNYLSPLGDSLNAIIVCPDPYLQDQPRSEVVLNLAYDSVMTWFNIDLDQVYITGYSAGSDVAAQYYFGDPTHPMKGLIWHSPGFFSTPDLSNPQEIPPVCLCNGTVDFVSIVQANILNNSLSNAGFPYLYNQIPGVDHTMEYPTFTEEMLECIHFIDANSSNVSVEEWSGNAVSIYPNPVSSDQFLTVPGLTGSVNISMVDPTGKLVWNQAYTNVSNNLIIRQTARELPAGLYSVLILSEEGFLTKKLFIR